MLLRDGRRGPLDAVVTVPGSKSIANRALVCAALADGDSRLRGMPRRRRHRGDGRAACRRLGVACRAGRATTPSSPGPAAGSAAGAVALDAALAGTTSRFVTAVAALAAGPGHRRRGSAAAASPDGARSTTPSPRSASACHADDGAGRLPVTITGPLRRGGTVDGAAATCPASTSPR